MLGGQMVKLLAYKLVLVITLLHSLVQCWEMKAKFYQTSTIVSTTSNHELTVQFKYMQIPAGSYLQITYPSVWGIGAVTGGNMTSDFCETGCNLSSVQTTLSVPNRTVQIKNLFPSLVTIVQSRTIRYTLKNFVNPAYALSYSFPVKLIDSTNTYIDSALADVSVTPKQITCSSSRTSTTVSAVTDYQFTVNPSSLSLPSNLYIIMMFPTIWSSSSEAGTYSNSTCSSLINPLISCVSTNGNINASNVLLSTTSSSFSFGMTNIKNPGSEESNYQLSFQLFTAGSQIAYCTVPITGTTAKPVAGMSFSAPGSLGSLTRGVVSFTLTEIHKSTDTVQIELPKDYICSQIFVVFVYLDTETEAALHINSSSSTITVLTLQPFTDSIGNYQIRLYYLQIPKTTAVISPIKMSILRNGALVASQTCCSMSYPLLQSSQGITVTLSTTAVGSSATHFIMINGSLALSFPNDYYYLMVRLDSKYSLGSASYSCYVENSESIVDALVCSRNSTTSILVSNFSSSNRIGNGVFVIGITSITTPVTLASLVLSVITLDANYNGIQNLTTSYTLTATKINSIVVSPSVLSTYSTTTYTFTINNTNSLNVGTIALIRFPSQVHLNSGSLCFINNTQLSAANCIIDTSNSTHLATLGLTNTGVVGSTGLVTTNITISQVVNPLSLSQTTSFNVQLVSSTGEIIQELKEGVFVTMTSVATSFSSLNLAISDNHTMSSSDYNFQFSIPVDVLQDYGASSSYSVAGIKCVVVLPTEYSCLARSTTKSCVVAGERDQLTYTMVSTSNASTYSFIVPSVVNPTLTTITSIIVVRLYLSNYLSIQQNYNALTLFEPSVITYALTQSGYELGEKSKVFLTVTGISNWVSSNSSKYMNIAPPTEYSVDGSEIIACNQAGVTISKTVATIGSITRIVQIKLDNISSLTNLSISIVDILNPSVTSSSSGWTVELRESASGNLIAHSDTATDVIFSLICILPCRTCLSNDSSACLSCYTSVSSITEKYLDTNAHACRPSCLSNQYLSLVATDFTCETCSSSCLQCLNVSDNCTSCNTGEFLYLATSKCMTQCPPQFYNDAGSSQCIPCLPPCLYCSGPTGLTCTLCLSNLVLTNYSNGTITCTPTCPAAYYNNSNTCKLCPNCVTCTAPGYCTVCISGFYLYNNSCLSECPNGNYLSIASSFKVCQACQSPCLTCVGNSTYCTSCNTSTVLYRYLYPTSNTSNCTGICPSQYYPTQNFICQPCIPPCLACSSPTACSSCVSGYYFYLNTQSCQLVCPNSTISLSSPLRCEECSQPCLECAGSINFCTSCIEGYFLDSQSNICNLTCNLPYFAINRKCSRCQQPCLTCANLQVSVCTTCISTYKLLGTTCYVACPEGSFQNSPISCSLCTSGCLTCQNSSSTCLSCFPGLYLYQHMCLPNCPTSPTFYYQYQMQCIACQPQCTTCISSPIECSSCSNPNLYFNEITRQCTSNCTSPYYSALNTTDMVTKLCIKCQLPCKTCANSYSQCASCYNGRYLLNSQCVRSCGSSNFPNSDLNICMPCSSNCLSCNSATSCTQCDPGTYFFQGACFTTCPPAAHYTYLGKYCRNCLLDHCLLCDSSTQTQTQSCLLCEPGYYLYNQKCEASCPEGYEIDSVTKSLCIQSQTFALINYFKKLQKFKTYSLPGAALLLVSLILLCIYVYSFGSTQPGIINTYIIKTNICMALLAAPQYISLVCYFVYLLLNSQFYHISSHIRVAYFALFSMFFVINTIQLCLVFPLLRNDAFFLEWKSKSFKNNFRFTFIMAISVLLNCKIFFLLFSGLWKVPVTCCQISAQTLQVINKRLKIIYLCNIIFIECTMTAYVIYTVLLENYFVTDFRLLYGTLDLALLCISCIIIEIIFIARGLEIPSIYKKYILEKVSNKSIAAWSEKLPQEPEEEDDFNLHKSNSAEALPKHSEEIDAIQYKSVFDTQDFEDPDYIQPFKLETAIDQGKFRKKNLKRKKRDGRDFQLGVIEQDSSQSAQEKVKKAKKHGKLKKSKVGYIDNFIYWKPPQKKEKKQPEKEFKMHQKQIMQTIRQKESDFDAITRNDFIFQEQGSIENSSHDSDPNFEIEDSRRALNYQYETFLNKNYAKRRHLK